MTGSWSRVLQIGLMFLVELGAALAAQSTALLAESVDMFVM
jgi:Co/Zn/Cd efflux system component